LWSAKSAFEVYFCKLKLPSIDVKLYRVTFASSDSMSEILGTHLSGTNFTKVPTTNEPAPETKATKCI